MAIPDYQSLMLPVLRFLEDKNEHSLRETIDALGKTLKLSDKELRDLLPSGARRPGKDRSCRDLLISWLHGRGAGRTYGNT